MTPEQQEQTAALMRSLADGLSSVLNPDGKKIAFVLLVAPFGSERDAETGKRVNYVSNGGRSDILAMMKEVVARFEGQPVKSGRA